MDNINTYISLHNHSQYSNLRLIDSINKENDLLDYAYSLGLKGMALTDHESLSGHIKLHDYWESKYKDKDFKLILGNEIYIARSDLNADTYQRGEPFYHFILLAKDKEGYRQLRELSSRAWTRGFCRVMTRVWNTPEDLFEIIKGGHIVGSTACLGSYTGRKFLAGELDKVNAFITKMANLFGEGNFYIELQPSFNQDQIEYNKYLIQTFWGRYPFIFTTDAHYMKKEDAGLHKAFLNSKDGDREVDAFYSATYEMSYEEVWNYFKYYVSIEQMREMAANTLHIGDMCEDYSLKQNQVIPQIVHDERPDIRKQLYPFATEERPYLKYFIETKDESDRYFMIEVVEGWNRENIATNRQEAYANELEIELRTIKLISENKKAHLADYFTTMAKLMDIIWDKADSLVGPSRGSAGAFLINYLLGITQMNPLEQPVHMASWRFLDPDRPDYPD